MGVEPIPSIACATEISNASTLPTYPEMLPASSLVDCAVAEGWASGIGRHREHCKIAAMRRAKDLAAAGNHGMANRRN